MDEEISPILTPELLFSAYCEGVFPMAEPDGEIRWYAPYQRALFPIEGIHVSRSLAKTIRSDKFQVTFDTAFESVMRCCLRPAGNWISKEMIRAYTQAHVQGWAHSCEVWQKGNLVGGIYGLQIGTCFSAESMFHKETDASKVALWAMVNHCRAMGITIFDAQIMNPHLKSMGAYEIDQADFVSLVRQSLR